MIDSRYIACTSLPFVNSYMYMKSNGTELIAAALLCFPVDDLKLRVAVPPLRVWGKEQAT